MSAEHSANGSVNGILNNVSGNTANGLQQDGDGVAYCRKECSRWQKYGHDRLYFNDDSDGYIDLETGGVEGETPIVAVEVKDGRVLYYARDVDHKYPVASRVF